MQTDNDAYKLRRTVQTGASTVHHWTYSGVMAEEITAGLPRVVVRRIHDVVHCKSAVIVNHSLALYLAPSRLLL